MPDKLDIEPEDTLLSEKEFVVYLLSKRMKMTDIAEILGISVNNVRGKQGRIRKKLSGIKKKQEKIDNTRELIGSIPE